MPSLRFCGNLACNVLIWIKGMRVHTLCFAFSVWRKSWVIWSPVSYGNPLSQQCVSNRCVMCSHFHMPTYTLLTVTCNSTVILFLPQLLKTLFGTNLASQYDGTSSHPCRSQGKALRLGSSSLRPGLYHYCFMAPYTHFTQALADASLRNMVQAEHEQDASGWVKTLTFKDWSAFAELEIVLDCVRLFFLCSPAGGLMSCRKCPISWGQASLMWHVIEETR